MVLLPGGDVPFILAPSEASYFYNELIGECYVEGVMHGEAYESLTKDTSLHRFDIIRAKLRPAINEICENPAAFSAYPQPICEP